MQLNKTNMLTVLGLIAAVLIASKDNLPQQLAYCQPWINWALAVEVGIAGVIAKGDDKATASSDQAKTSS